MLIQFFFIYEYQLALRLLLKEFFYILKQLNVLRQSYKILQLLFNLIL